MRSHLKLVGGSDADAIDSAYEACEVLEDIARKARDGLSLLGDDDPLLRRHLTAVQETTETFLLRQRARLGAA